MATKPVTSYLFATNALFTVGAFAGSATKVIPPDTMNGFVPGTTITAEPVNYMFAISGDWITDWLLLGSLAPDLDAHLVETNASGQTNIAAGVFGNTAAGDIALSVGQNSGAVSTAILASNTSTGFAITGSALGANAAIRGVNTGTGAGIEGLALGTDNDGVQGTGTGSGAGGDFTGGATGPGVFAQAGATGDFGVVGIATGAFFGVEGRSGGGVLAQGGVRGTANIPAAMGVWGVANAAGITTAYGVLGEGLADSPGVKGLATDGYGVEAQSDLTVPMRASFRVVPQGADPTVPLSGDMMHRSDIDIQRVYEESIWKSPWATARGLAFGIAAVGSITANADDTTYVVVANCNLSVPNAPKFAGGIVLLHFACEFGDEDTTLHHYFVDIQLYDSTAAAVVFEWSNEGTATAAPLCTGPAVVDAVIDGEVHSAFAAAVPYTIPAAGARTFQVRFKPNANIGGSDALIGNITLQVTGVYG